jgi:hypothetical protein
MNVCLKNGIQNDKPYSENFISAFLRRICHTAKPMSNLGSFNMKSRHRLRGYCDLYNTDYVATVTCTTQTTWLL